MGDTAWAEGKLGCVEVVVGCSGGKVSEVLAFEVSGDTHDREATVKVCTLCVTFVDVVPSEYADAVVVVVAIPPIFA